MYGKPTILACVQQKSCQTPKKAGRRDGNPIPAQLTPAPQWMQGNSRNDSAACLWRGPHYFKDLPCTALIIQIAIKNTSDYPFQFAKKLS